MIAEWIHQLVCPHESCYFWEDEKRCPFISKIVLPSIYCFCISRITSIAMSKYTLNTNVKPKRTLCFLQHRRYLGQKLYLSLEFTADLPLIDIEVEVESHFLQNKPAKSAIYNDAKIALLHFRVICNNVCFKFNVFFLTLALLLIL